MRIVAVCVVVTLGVISAESDVATSEVKKREDLFATYLTSDKMNKLESRYNLQHAKVGPFKFAELWRSDKIVEGKPGAVAYILVLKDGICGVWSQWPVDRYYNWHGGFAMIDKIHPNGTLVSECLGSSEINDKCDYVVKIPAGWYADIRTDKNHAIISAVVLNGDVSDGRAIRYEYMKAKFGQQHGDIIGKEERCYKQ